MKQSGPAPVGPTPGARRLARLNGIPLDTIPIEMQLAAIPFQWDRDRLWELDTPISYLPASELEWHLDVPFWAHDAVPFQLTPNQVRLNPNGYQDQLRRTLDADLNHPLVVMRWRRRWTILDGVHRLLKSTLVGVDPLPVRILGPSEFWRVAQPIRRSPAESEQPI